MTRAAACGLVLLLGGCVAASDDTPPRPVAAPPLSYDYLTKLGLSVSDIVVDDTWTPLADSTEHVEDEATPRPVEALSRMIRDRLVASGGASRALATIEDASLVRVPGQLVGTFSVQIAVQGASGQGTAGPPGPVTASVSGTRTLASDSSEQQTADTLVRQLMDRMNVELEYQVRHQLSSYAGGALSPVPSAVQTESLPPPGSTAPLTVTPPPSLSSPAVPANVDGTAPPTPSADPPAIEVPATEPPTTEAPTAPLPGVEPSPATRSADQDGAT